MPLSQSVKINADIVRRVKRHVIDSRETISEFIESAVERKLRIIENRQLKFIKENFTKKDK